MNGWIAAMLLLPIAFVFGACKTVKGSGTVVKERRDVSGFDGIALAGSGAVIVTQGDEESLVIEAEDNLIPLIETKVEDGILEIGTKDDNVTLAPTEPMVFHVGIKLFNSVSLAGSGRLESDGVKTGHLQVDLAGSGKVEISNLDAERVTVDIGGSGKAVLAGTTGSQTVNIAGSGSHDTPGLESRSATVNISGSGKAVVWAKDDLDVNLTGSGKVEYFGEPTLRQAILGSGKVLSRGNP
jgi:hypothetical protein